MSFVLILQHLQRTNDDRSMRGYRILTLSFATTLVVSITTQNGKWWLLVLDLTHPQTTRIQSTLSYQQKFPSMPLHESIFHFSTLHDSNSVKDFYKEIKLQCKIIMDAHSKYIPTYYTLLKEDMSFIIDLVSLPSKWNKVQ